VSAATQELKFHTFKYRPEKCWEESQEVILLLWSNGKFHRSIFVHANLSWSEICHYSRVVRDDLKAYLRNLH